MGPFYLAVFGIARKELKDERFSSGCNGTDCPRLTGESEMRESSGGKAKKEGKRREYGLRELLVLMSGLLGDSNQGIV